MFSSPRKQEQESKHSDRDNRGNHKSSQALGPPKTCKSSFPHCQRWHQKIQNVWSSRPKNLRACSGVGPELLTGQSVPTEQMEWGKCGVTAKLVGMVTKVGLPDSSPIGHHAVGRSTGHFGSLESEFRVVGFFSVFSALPLCSFAAVTRAVFLGLFFDRVWSFPFYFKVSVLK